MVTGKKGTQRIQRKYLEENGRHYNMQKKKVNKEYADWKYIKYRQFLY